MHSRIITIVGFSLLSIFILLIPYSYAQKMTHTVVAGDTLWDICEEYYGEPDLWPKLWQMNPFVTNPHLLKPGDVITLFEKEPVKKLPEIKETATLVTEQAPVKPSGIDLSGLTDLPNRGYMSRTPIKSLGKIFATNEDKLLLDKNDVVYLLIKEREIKQGDEFLVGRTEGPLKDPVSGKKLWHVFSVHGRIMIEGQAGVEFDNRNVLIDKKDTYQARIINSIKDISVGDVIIPPEPAANCIEPAYFQEPIQANIVATEGQRKLVGKYDIVYLNQGRNQSIQKGHLFEIVKANYAKNPEPIRRNYLKKNFMVLPDIPIGLCLVIDTRPDTATAVVLSIEEAFVLGTYIKSRSWDDHQNLLTGIQTCTLSYSE